MLYSLDFNYNYISEEQEFDIDIERYLKLRGYQK
jgi:hypothetical protein